MSSKNRMWRNLRREPLDALTVPNRHRVTVDVERLDRDIERASTNKARAESQASIARISARFAPKKV